MTKTQLRELKTVLLMIASRFPATVLDDETRVLLYRAQTLADESFARGTQVRELVPKVG
jgi:hypothetical protein